MKILHRKSAMVGLATTLAAGALVIAGVALADTPPWQPPGSAKADPNEVGTLAFYDNTGKQIFSGSTTDAPFAAYVVGSTVLRSNDSKASLFAYLPKESTPQGGWSGSQLSAATSYPNAAAPGALASDGQLVSLGATDTTLAEFVSDYPNTATDSYSGLYELRLRTSAPGNEASTQYDAADIQVTGDTWQVVYPDDRHTTTVGASYPSGILHYGTAFSVKATVSSGGVDTPSGTVALLSGSTQIGSATLSSGAATISVRGTALSVGKHSLTVAYKGSSDDAPSTSAATSLTIAKATSKTTDSVSPTKVKKGKHAKLAVTVKATGVTPTGSLTVYDGSKKIATGKLSGGKASITLPALAVGKHKIHAAYAGSSQVSGSTGGSVTLTVTK